MSDIQKLLDSVPLPEGGPRPADSLMANGWVYRDIPGRLSYEMWDYFLSLIGEGNFRILAMSVGPDWKRGQLLISPAGIENMKAHVESKRDGRA